MEARCPRDRATRLAVALRGVAPDDALIDAALTRLEEDEARHVLIATEVLERLGDHDHDARAELPVLDGDQGVAFAKSVVTALCVCESVSAARFAAVREHTDLPGFAACIEAFHRDELAHAELGFVLLPLALLTTDAHEAIARIDRPRPRAAWLAGGTTATAEQPGDR